MHNFLCKTKIVSGPGSLSYVKELGSKRLVVVADPYFMKNGVAKQVAALSGADSCAYFQKIVPDPSVELAAEGTALLQEQQPDTVIALGGGSAIDCAKAMVYFSKAQICFVAIPTTSGSGSEVTDFAILTHEQVKHPLVDPGICPDVAILDPDLLKELPPSLIADTGFDVLSHALEAYVSKSSSPFTDALANDAFCTVFSLLGGSFRGNIALRERIHVSATMAGISFSQSGLGLCHAMSHALGGAFHLPHGRLNAILLPEVISCNAHACGEKYARLARAAGLGGSADTMALRNLKNGLIRLRKELQMPETLAQAGVSPTQVRYQSRALVQAVLADPCCRENPLPVQDYMVRRILEAVTGHV